MFSLILWQDQKEVVFFIRIKIYSKIEFVFYLKKDLTEKKSLDLCENLWRDLGSKIKFLDLKDHDKILASTSHLPHFIAFSLVKSLSNLDSDKIYSGGGLKDFTRIAASDVKMWKDIFFHNKDEILKAIDDFTESVNLFRTQIKQDDLDKIEKFIEEAKAFKEQKLQMKRSIISEPSSLKGQIKIPGDKSVSHRALICGALASSPTKISNLQRSEDILNTFKVIKNLGIDTEQKI